MEYWTKPTYEQEYKADEVFLYKFPSKETSNKNNWTYAGTLFDGSFLMYGKVWKENFNIVKYTYVSLC